MATAAATGEADIKARGSLRRGLRPGEGVFISLSPAG
jgi:hypothetical protein